MRIAHQREATIRTWIAVSALVVGLALAGGAFVKAAPVTQTEDIDDPILHYFQQSANRSSTTSNVCTFAKVPAHKRLRLANASCYMQMSDTSGVLLVAVASTQPSPDYFLPAIPYQDAHLLSANGAISLVFGAGITPAVAISPHLGTLVAATCTVAGYMLKV